MVNIAVLGYGTVGSGVVEVINTNHSSIAKRAGKDIHIKYVLDLRDFEGDPVQKILVHDYETILTDESVDVVVEVMGGINPAYEFSKKALQAGKSVCTSNKELVAKHGAELLAIAKEKKVNYLFEASVGGGIPIIRPLNSSLTADEITEITGILNGTTNYILTEMSEKGADFDAVLKDAQDKGYAERNPEADVEGYDACRKIAILTSLVTGMQVDYEDIHTEGITGLTIEDFQYAEAMNASIKLLGTSKKIGGKFYSMVAPVMIKQDHPLAGVNGVFNGIFVHGNVLDDVMFYGRGAGKLPTASAVVSDVVDAVKHMGTNIMTIWEDKKTSIGAFEDFESKFFVRIKDINEGLDDTLMFAIRDAFGDVLYVKTPGIEGEFAFTTQSMREGDFAEKIAGFDNVCSVIRTNF